MKKSSLYYILLIVVVSALGFAFTYSNSTSGYVPKTSFTTADSADNEAFNTMMDVISHERCINCHPNDNIPKRGTDGQPHPFGTDYTHNALSFDALLCAACHKSENDDYAGVPGAPHWGLAPKQMAWEGLSRIEIAEAMLDPSKNGNRTHEQLVEHLTEDKLVLWAFNPGINVEGVPREKPPVAEEDYKNAVKIWFKNGAIIPKN